MNLLDNIDSCIVSSKCIERFHNLHVTVRKHDCHAPPSVRAHAPPSLEKRIGGDPIESNEAEEGDCARPVEGG